MSDPTFTVCTDGQNPISGECPLKAKLASAESDVAALRDALDKSSGMMWSIYMRCRKQWDGHHALGLKMLALEVDSVRTGAKQAAEDHDKRVRRDAVLSDLKLARDLITDNPARSYNCLLSRLEAKAKECEG